MGRHSIPDPEDSADDERPPQDWHDAPRAPAPEPRRHRYLDDDDSDAEADYRPGLGGGAPGLDESEQPTTIYDRPLVSDSDTGPDYRTPDYGRADDPGQRYQGPRYGEPGYIDPRYPEPGRRDQGYEEPGYAGPAFGRHPYGDEYDDQAYDEDAYDDEYEGEEYEGQEYEGYADEDYPGYGRAGFADLDGLDEATPQGGGSGTGGPPPPPARGQHSGDRDGGEWTGSHRAVTTGRRGVSVGVIAALVAVVVVVGAFVLWRFFGDALSHRSDAAAARCVDGELSVPVVADPTIADQIKDLASKYNDSASPVGDRCVKIAVQSAETDQVVNGFTKDWNSDLGDKPAMWVPASGVSEARLESVAGRKTISDSRSLVSSPVLIAVRPELKDALAQQNWGALPGLQSNPNSLDKLNLSGWGSLRLALPRSGGGDASYLAAEAVASASAPSGSPATSGMGAVNTLMSGQPKLADTKSSTAMDALINADDAAKAPVHGVVTTEQQLFKRASDMSDAKKTVAGWIPPGPTATADYPTVLLAGDWLSNEQVSAASEFARFMRKPEQLSQFANAGFRTKGATPPKSDVTSFAPVSEALSVGDAATRANLANALGTPGQSTVATIMLDQSMPTEEGGKSRLSNVVSALKGRLSGLPGNAEIGLWTFDGTEGRSEVSRGQLSDQVNGKQRSQALTDTLDDQSASNGGAVSFTTLRMIYGDAMSNFVQGKPNSILVITAGPHTDKSLDGDGLQQYIRDTFDRSKPVAVNVIDFGSDSDRSTWEAVAQASGGTYQNLSSSSSPELTSAITSMLK